MRSFVMRLQWMPVKGSHIINQLIINGFEWPLFRWLIVNWNSKNTHIWLIPFKWHEAEHFAFSHLFFEFHCEKSWNATFKRATRCRAGLKATIQHELTPHASFCTLAFQWAQNCSRIQIQSRGRLCRLTRSGDVQRREVVSTVHVL